MFVAVRCFGAIPRARHCFAPRSCKQLSALPLLRSRFSAIDRVTPSSATMPPKRATKRTAAKTEEEAERNSEDDGDVKKRMLRKASRKVDRVVDSSEPAVVSEAKKPKIKSQKTVKRSKNETVEGEDTGTTEETPADAAKFSKAGVWKVVSWNVNGIRGCLSKGGLEYIRREDADVFCIQEMKCSEGKLPSELSNINGYHSYFLAGDKEGYSGVGVLSKRKPLKVTYGIGKEEHDSEGRVITLEFDEFFIVNTYVPNAGRGLVRLEYRLSWDKDFREYLVGLKKKKGVILTGDLNVAHNEIDLKNPKTNRKNAGFTDEERQGLTDLLKEGFVDSFRKLYPEREGAYTFWTYMRNARASNVGWRLDYYIVSENLIDKVVDNEMRSEIMGSDHCPIVLHLQ